MGRGREQICVGGVSCVGRFGFVCLKLLVGCVISTRENSTMLCCLTYDLLALAYSTTENTLIDTFSKHASFIILTKKTECTKILSASDTLYCICTCSHTCEQTDIATHFSSTINPDNPSRFYFRAARISARSAAGRPASACLSTSAVLTAWPLAALTSSVSLSPISFTQACPRTPAV